MLDYLIAAGLGALGALLCRDRQDVIDWWKYKRHGLSVLRVDVPDEYLECGKADWGKFKKQNPDMIVILNGDEVK